MNPSEVSTQIIIVFVNDNMIVVVAMPPSVGQ